MCVCVNVNVFTREPYYGRWFQKSRPLTAHLRIGHSIRNGHTTCHWYRFIPSSKRQNRFMWNMTITFDNNLWAPFMSTRWRTEFLFRLLFWSCEAIDIATLLSTKMRNSLQIKSTDQPNRYFVTQNWFFFSQIRIIIFGYSLIDSSGHHSSNNNSVKMNFFPFSQWFSARINIIQMQLYAHRASTYYTRIVKKFNVNKTEWTNERNRKKAKMKKKYKKLKSKRLKNNKIWFMSPTFAAIFS